MNYAQKNLDTTTQALQTARATFEALKGVLEGPYRPQQITLTTVAASVTVPLPAFEGEDAGIASTFYAELLDHAELRVQKLEKDQLYWCEEAVLLNRQQERDDARREVEREAAQQV